MNVFYVYQHVRIDTGVCSRGEGSASKKVKFENIIFDCIKDLADFVGTNHKTMYTRLSRNPQKWGYEVIK